jgi:hypothetical protein
MLAICGGLLFVGVRRHELAAMAPCRRNRRLRESEARSTPDATAREDAPDAEYPPLQLVRA